MPEKWIEKKEKHLKKNKSIQDSGISNACSLERIADFWDSHSLSEYEDQTHEVEFKIRAERRRRISIAPELYDQIETKAGLQGIQPEALVNQWIAERLQVNK